MSLECGEWSVEFWSSGQIAITQKFSARIYLYAASPQVWFLVFLLNVGNGQDCSLHWKKQNITNKSKFVEETNLSK